jgi:hypothetical protein
MRSGEYIKLKTLVNAENKKSNKEKVVNKKNSKTL